jgi:hypothetical protein
MELWNQILFKTGFKIIRIIIIIIIIFLTNKKKMGRFSECPFLTSNLTAWQVSKNEKSFARVDVSKFGSAFVSFLFFIFYFFLSTISNTAENEIKE